MIFLFPLIIYFLCMKIISVLFFTFQLIICNCVFAQEKTQKDSLCTNNRQQDKKLDEIEIKNKRAREEARKLTFSDSTFLKTKQPMSDDAIAPYDYKTGLVGDKAYNIKVYVAALERVKKKLLIKDNQFIISCNSGAKINIAEDLYQYIVHVIKTWNEGIINGIYKIEKLKTGGYDISIIKKRIQ